MCYDIYLFRDKDSDSNKRDKNDLDGMADKETGASGGLMSSAGLTTYYDAEDQTFALDPKTITLLVVISAIGFIMLNVLF